MNESDQGAGDSNAAQPLLRVLAEGGEICSVVAEELPVEKFATIPIANDDTWISFVDLENRIRRFEVPLAYAEGGRFLHMSIRVSGALAVQVDGVLTTRVDEDPGQAFRAGSKAVRFAPFMLTESPGLQSATAGRGLFFRGLHFSGTVTPTNLSALCLCDHCNRSFRLASFHSGFALVSYFYCSKGPHTLTVSSPQGSAASIDEARLPPCSKCDGVFRYMNPFRCPHCLQPYIDFTSHPEEREIERYGNYIYGDSTTPV